MTALVLFREIDVSDAEKILKWRRQSRVTEFLTTDVDDNLSAQKNWVRASYAKPGYYHWIFQLNGVDAGILNVSDFDPTQGVTSWGYYVGEYSFFGLGAMIPPYLYNWLFRFVGISKIHVEVFSTNHLVLRMHSHHGYIRMPRNDRTIVKAGQEVALQSLELTASDWLKQRDAERFIADFPTNRWSARPSSLGASN